MSPLRRPRALSAGLPLLAALVFGAVAHGAPALRKQVNQAGDFVLLGNTSAFDCDASVPSPVVGTVPDPRSGCGPNITDDAPDVFFRASDTAAVADLSVSPNSASSTARLVLPEGATITFARLYWAALLPVDATLPDTTVTLTRPGVAPLAVTADDTHFIALRYQSAADVTAFVRAQGPGAYRVSGIGSRDFRNQNDTNAFVAWAMVVFYALPGEPQRNLTLFDGFDQVKSGSPAVVSLSGFRVPPTGFDAKLGVVAYEGDLRLTGDSLSFNGQVLSDAQNPANNFFNGSRSYLGSAVSVAGDLPQMTGAPGSMNGIDLDVVDVRAQLSQGQTTATIAATSSLDVYYLGVFVTSIATLTPDFTQSTKTVRTIAGTGTAPGDVLEYTIVARNTGSDASVGTLMTDTLPAGVTFVPGSLEITSGPNAGAKSDQAGDDQGEYVSATRTVVVRLGAGANGTAGGTLARGEASSLRFRVTIDAGATGTLSNQAVIRAAGQSGAPTASFSTDGDTTVEGQQPTVTILDACRTDGDCAVPNRFCDTGATPKVCVQCRTRADCSGRAPVCASNHTCVACDPMNAATCPDPSKPACLSSGANAGACAECSTANQSLCGGAKPQCLNDLGICGCTDTDGDSECGGPTSGVVCSGAAGLCVPGCSLAPNRNRCPGAQVCSNTAGGVGTCIVGSCASDADCTSAPLSRCYLPAHACVQCLGNADCTGGLVCETATHRCQECSSTDSSHCSATGAGLACLASGACGCATDADCGSTTSGRICDAATSRCTTGCRGAGGNGCPTGQHCGSTTSAPGTCVGCIGDADCGGNAPHCNTTTQRCVACTSDGPPSCSDVARPACHRTGPLAGACTECSAQNASRCGGDTPACDGSRGVCVGCVDNRDCGGAAPFCDPTMSACVACRGDGAPSCADPDRPVCFDDGACGCRSDADCGDDTSGRICDGDTRACKPGCRGEGGNGCPSGRACSSTTSAPGTCELIPSDGGAGGDGGSGDEGTCAEVPASNGRPCGDDGRGLCVDGRCVRAELSGAGCACDQGGGSSGSGLWLLALAALFVARFLRRRSRAALSVAVGCALALVAMGAGSARAGTAAIDVEHFWPNVDGRGLFAADSADAHAPAQWSLGLLLHWAKDPLILRVGDERLADAVNHRLTANLLFSIGVARWLELGLALPVSFWNDQNAGLQGSSSAAGLGTLRLSAKAPLLREGLHGVGLALQATLGFPTGDTNVFLGQENVVFAPAAIVEKSFGPVRVLATLGALIRERATYLNLDVASELFLRLGLGWRVHDKVELGVELDGSTPMSAPFGTTSAGNPLELLVGARILPTDDWQVWAGGGPGLSYGYGSPRVRLFAGVAYGPHERDTDGDGIPDRLDRCPKEKGPRENQGCPVVDKDTDGDGVLDKDDKCPTVPGPAKNRGCPWPDFDKDGVPDNKDRCPDEPGPAENEGCPYADRDKDGVLDKDDKCPDVKGPKENHGCPWPDRDGDGVLDKDDKCPDVKGPKENHGCPWPDRDGDGVPDKDDECPLQPGPASNKGCPEKARVVVTRTEVKILDRVNFETSSAVLTEDSHGILDQVASVMKKLPSIRKVEIQGHTDDRGRRAMNQRLSQRRAESVALYLVEAGIDRARLHAKGYGSDVPAVKIDDLEGKELRDARAQNRRVQFVILEQAKEEGP